MIFGSQSIETEENEMPKLNFDGLCSYYIPIQGTISLSLLSIHSLDPFISSKIFNNMNPAGILLTSSTIGAASYLYTKNPIKRLQVCSQFLFSISGGMMFSLAAMYGWHLYNQILPDIPIVNSIIGVTTTYGYAKICQRYISIINSITAKRTIKFSDMYPQYKLYE